MAALQQAARKSEAPLKLVASDVRKEFSLRKGEKITAVEKMSFEVRENEMCVLLGPSGCGKSTVLKIVAGLEMPTSGSMRLDGREIVAPGRERGMVFQAYTSFPWLTVRQNVEYGLRINGMGAKERRERAEYYIDLVHLSKFRDVYPKQLSGGMKQRVAIARTLANEPALLLMDEPFGALDAETRWHMQEFMIEILESSKITVLMVTHDIDEALFLADHIVFMSTHPGTKREDLWTDFKNGVRIRDKEEILGMDGYRDMETKILRMMREESLLKKQLA
ncbi:MAG: ABC transporter ATP-binding protein [Hyphomicrobium sp.]|uniref:ABC transporter ATP-binding protein n=1 Tax=Hyphomicrobium sp. TaxID=82 RepID=UPI003D128309